MSAIRKFLEDRGHDAICGRHRNDAAVLGLPVVCECGYDEAMEELEEYEARGE